MSYSEADRVKWEKVLISDLISSDESDEDEHGQPILVIKELKWRSDRVSSFFSRLDELHHQRKSEQAVRQTKARVYMDKTSQRLVPASIPAWAIATD